MKKIYLSMMAVVALLCASFGAKAVGWPANYQGVMLQGFYWDSYKGNDNTRWSTLTARADELSQYFKLIWVPNSARANGENGGGNGYMPVYWFSNHNCAFGTEAELKTMISTYKAKGVGFIEDVVVNHRVGSSNWYNFPAETWNGRTYQLTNGAICSTDEMWRQGGQGCPYTRGAADTGEDFDGARDLDHTNATVQDNVKNYCKFLIDEMGYVGFRLDMVKGYSGQYTKIYNQYARPTYSVGEYWDGSYDALAAWIEATGKESAAFDFAFKYRVNEAFHSNNLSELTWTDPSGAPQPAGLIHYGYQQLAVTFIDNHDTYRDGSKFNGNVPAANAFMLCSPGTPCVFYPHYQAYKSQIQALINVRNQVGVHNQSQVKVLETNNSSYVAEVTGTKGKLIVKIGNSSYQPNGGGYTLKTSGNGYAVWATTSGGVNPGGGDNPGGGGNVGGSYPSSLYLLGNINGKNWSTSDGPAAQGSNGVYCWPEVTVDNSGDDSGYFAFVTKLGATWDVVNEGDRYGATATNTPIALGQSSTIRLYAANVDASGSQSWKIAPGQYSITADLSKMTVTIATAGTKPTPTPGTYPAKLYMMGHINGYSWATDKGIETAGTNGVYTWQAVSVDDCGDGNGYIAFATQLGSTWDDVNAGDRYGAPSADQPISAGQNSQIKLYAANVDASGSQSWKIAAGKYDVKVDLPNLTLTLSNPSSSGVEDLFDADDDAPVQYFNLQGVRVENPEKGIYIMVKGNKAVKVML